MDECIPFHISFLTFNFLFESVALNASVSDILVLFVVRGNPDLGLMSICWNV